MQLVTLIGSRLDTPHHMYNNINKTVSLIILITLTHVLCCLETKVFIGKKLVRRKMVLSGRPVVRTATEYKVVVTCTLHLP